jgi:hypothetical protein
LDRAGHLNHLDVQSMFSVNARILGNKEGQKREAECGIAHADLFFEFLGGGRLARYQDPER